ncbi:MAG: S9 family peptidase [Gammaproteobacteria bacterium]|nr:S9 family peptidase [Gammaproteobacteria bacterium]MDH5303760.1 S9 family peptidase [Gammaproteobacteria bacterium]MDH5322653.1 S9 family peptidase [Gammaproteobacteria bacterium]
MRILALTVLASVAFGGCSHEVHESKAPLAAKKPVTLELHGERRIDNYYWLRERENPEVIAWLEAENAFTEEVMSPFSGLKNILVEEIKSRMQQDESTVPYRLGDYFYYHRYEPGEDYPVYARRKGSLDAPEQVLLDVSELAGDADFFAVSGFSVSPDHRIAAYGVDTVGRRFYDIYFIDLASGRRLADVIENTTADIVWARDSQTILYGKQHAETLRSYQVYRHELGSSEDSLVYQEDDETNYLSLDKSPAHGFIFLVSGHTLYSEVRYVAADSPGDEPALFLPREKDHVYTVADGGDRFYVLTDDNGSNFRLVEVPLASTSKASWKEVVPYRDDVLIEGMTVLQDYVVLELLENGLVQMEVLDRSSGKLHRIAFDEDVYTAYGDDNAEYDAATFRYVYESLATPESTYDYSLADEVHTLVREKAVIGSFDRSNYETRRLFATARDGTLIPISMVYRKGMQKDGSNSLLQYGYGSYGSSLYPYFSADRLSLLDRDFIYVMAHIRGGSEMGREWYYQGRQLQKMNTFTDFIDVSKFLIAEGYTSPQHLYAEGGSAGGLLMGAVMNMAPELYNGVIATVPFVDVVTTMLDEKIPLTSGEWDEWGDPRQKEFYDYMLSYSPYDNIRAIDYPNLLVTTALHDSQVQYWEPAKWVAKLREFDTGDNMLVLKTDMAAGHGGKTGRFKRIDDTAFKYSFLMGLEGIRE